MAASFPTSVKSFTTKSSGDTVQASHINDVQDEIVAIETALGSGSLSKATYSPTWTNVTVGNGTVTAHKLVAGDLVWFSIQLVFGSTTSVTGTIFVTLPVTGASTQIVVGTCTGADSSAGSFNTGILRGSTTTIDLRNFDDPTGVWNASVPFTWASGDTLRIGGWYFKG